VLTHQFHEASDVAKTRFAFDDFATIEDDKLTLKRDDKIAYPLGDDLAESHQCPLAFDRIEQLLMEVDHLTALAATSHQCKAISRAAHFYKTLMATLISQATNLGVVSMSASVQGISVDMLRHVLQDFVREETLTVASAEIVNRHHDCH